MASSWSFLCMPCITSAQFSYNTIYSHNKVYSVNNGINEIILSCIDISLIHVVDWADGKSLYHGKSNSKNPQI